MEWMTLSSKIIKAVSLNPITETKVLKQITKSYEEWNDTPSTEQETDESINDMLERARQQIAFEQEQARLSFQDWCSQEREKIEKEYSIAKEKGYESGLLEGKKEAIEQITLQYNEKIQEAANILEKAYQEKQSIINEAEPFIIELCMEIAKKVIQQELKTHPDVLITIIKNSLALSNERQSIIICVNPEDFSFVQHQRQQLLQMIEGQTELKILPDHSIQNGGCIIRTSYGSIDARIDVQLNEIQQALLQTMKVTKNDD
jgi:flagellar assembly protein FliH